MAQVVQRKVRLLNIALVFFTCVLIMISAAAAAAYNEGSPMSHKQLGPKRMLSAEVEVEVEVEDDKVKPITKKSKTKVLMNQTILLTNNQNQTKLIKDKFPSDELKKNKTSLMKPTTSSSDSTKTIKTQKLKQLNSTSSPKISVDLIKTSSPKNKTSKPFTANESPTKAQIQSKRDKEDPFTNEKPKPEKAQRKRKMPSWVDEDDEDDGEGLVSGLRELPTKFQEALLPDLEKISKTSQVYLTRYNKEITKGVKPILGKKYASTMASAVLCAFVTIPLVLVFLVFNRIKAYFSLQKLLIFVQIYLSIYFSILWISSIITGLEPLKFFYATSQSTYVCLQVLQTLAYVLYLLLLLMYLVLVFSTETGLVTKLLGLAQTFVGFAVGLHYYVKVFHWVVLRQPPKTSWKVHALYAACFLLICVFNRVDGRKKAYLEEDGEEGKKS